MRLVEFTTNEGLTFLANPESSGFLLWTSEYNKAAHVLFNNREHRLNCTYREAVDKINAALEPAPVPAAKTWEVETIGEAIRRMRSIAGFMHSELAPRIGLHTNYIRVLEAGEAQPDLRTIKAICQTTNCSLTVTGDGFVVQERGDNE
jgi:ribosome-binding protein aMBF1 (putative translation factor)